MHPARQVKPPWDIRHPDIVNAGDIGKALLTGRAGQVRRLAAWLQRNGFPASEIAPGPVAAACDRQRLSPRRPA